MQMYDLLIIGAGTAGLSAAIYAARGGLSTLVFEGAMYGGQIIVSPTVENYPGVGCVSGAAFANQSINFHLYIPLYIQLLWCYTDSINS